MSNTSNKSDATSSSDEGIDQILSDIKHAITNPSSQESVLVLTEQVEEGLNSNTDNDSTMENCPPAEEKFQQPVMHQDQDILKQLDEDVAKSEVKQGFTQDEGLEQMAASPLIKEEVAAATKNAISEMLRGAHSQEFKSPNNSILASKTLEDVVISLLKTELQIWLNENLEGMVKSIVENEIKQIIPK
ncbi:MAG: DUF2497 domain-containing protein [Candidatus Jidaibacter sp.]|jgi:cell pole-organizing protein PopZ|nr:DUF2497 domain-containing protein [Candidatus Jidaibacter sp.]